jgi:N-acylneuraminate cytidylyltransferase
LKLAVVPARGGSKRIPRKNIRAFAGKPMIAWPIEAALAAGVFDRVIVSTDDEEIAACARACGAEVPFLRPAELADDHADTRTVIAHAIAWLRAQGEAPDFVCCIYATAAFVQPDDIRAAMARIESGDWRYVLSATAFSGPVFRGFLEEGTRGLRMLFPGYESRRSQDLPEVLHDAAQFYWGRADAWMQPAPIFAEGTSALRIPRWRSQDIDTDEDWAQAEALMALLLARKHAGGA